MGNFPPNGARLMDFEKKYSPLCRTVEIGRNLPRQEIDLHGNPLEWRWVNELGMHNAVDARELVDALISGRMTPHVWVWRTGWKSWIRASQVPDLITAIPKGARLPPVAIDIDPSMVEPPAIPQYTFRAATYVRHASTPVPQPMYQRPLVRRPAPPTMVDAENVTSHTLRPAGAVPPPPRTFSETFSFDVQRALDLATFASDNAAAAAPSITGQQAPDAEAKRPSQRPSVAPDLVPVPASDFVIQSVLAEEDAKGENDARSGATLAAIESQIPRARPPQIQRKLLVAGISLVVVASTSIVWVRARVNHEHPMNALALESATPPSYADCSLVASAERIAPSITFNVPPIVETTPDGRALAVGFSDTATSAAGIIVDPVTRSVKYAFRKTSNERVATVVPRIANGQLTFDVAWDSDVLKDARPVAGPPAFVFGHTVEGFSRQVGAARSETVWPTDIDATISGARLITVPNLGHAVTYRQGGKTGTIWVGWLTLDGRSRIAPFAVQTESKLVGQPNIATSGGSTLVTFAGRANDKERWQVHLFKAPADGREQSERVFGQAPDGPGGDSIAPVAAGLGDGRFLLQWSEGSAGHWQVRVQMLSESLQPLGPTMNVSPPDTNAGQGVLWVNGTHAVSLFIVNAGRGAELWAASIECPR